MLSVREVHTFKADTLHPKCALPGGSPTISLSRTRDHPLCASFIITTGEVPKPWRTISEGVIQVTARGSILDRFG